LETGKQPLTLLVAAGNAGLHVILPCH